MNCSEEEVEVQGSVEDHFRRLPDDIVFLIFSNLLDVKWLCRCSMVSKRFASIVFQIRTVYVSTLPNVLSHFRCNPYPVTKFYGIPPKSAFSFLKKLKSIQSLHIEISPCCRGGICSSSSSPLVKWASRSGTKLESLLVLLPTSLHRVNPLENKGEGHQIEVITRDEWMHGLDLALDCLHHALQWHVMLLSLVQQHRHLHSITITDSKKQGKLSLRGERLVELTNLVNSATIMPILESIRIPEGLKSCRVPMLRLPSSGFVMEGVILFFFKLANGDGGDDDADLMADAFEEEEEAFGEAVKEILLNHKSKLMTLK